MRSRLLRSVLTGSLLIEGGGRPPAAVGGDSFLLLETGDFFLLETGDKLILES